MRKHFGKALRIGVSKHGLALVKTSRWAGAPVTVVAEHQFHSGLPGFEALAAGVRHLLAGYAGWSATIVLDDELTRVWQVTPPSGASRLADLEGAAALRFQSLFGESAALWQLSAGWDAAQPFLAAAMPRHLLALLQQAATEQQVRLVEIVPQFVAGYNQWCGALKPGAWYGLVQQGVLTLGALDDTGVRAVRVASLPDGASLEWLGQHVAREALRLNLAAPARVQLSGSAPAAWNGGMCSLLAQVPPAWSGAVKLAATGART
ncbi:MAG: hypothetical protein V4484_09060 [Pseudomonadota bacterium]